MHNIFMKSDKNIALEKSKNVEWSDSLKLAQQILPFEISQ